jgi:D-beta-D-heptose 7-phosphate kinase/D-beta-D-heptose 1-phosphate adenosyltransferase
MATLRAITTRLAGRRISVIGDVMLDHFVIGRVDRISPEAPVPVVRFERDEYRLGGAANVAHNVQSLGGRATLVGLAGDDEVGRRLRSELSARGLDDHTLVVDPARPTTRKTRIVTSHNQQVARIDYEADAEPAGAVLAELCRAAVAALQAADAVVLSDYRKGVVGPEVIAAVRDAARAAGRPLLVDPKVPSAARYRGVTLLTPNHHEAELMTGLSIRTSGGARDAARAIHQETEGASVLITWGEHGMWLLDASSATTREEAIPAAAREVSDVTGAGDTVIATLALALAAGATIGDAARLATLAAGLVVARFGPATASLAEIQALV